MTREDDAFYVDDGPRIQARIDAGELIKDEAFHLETTVRFTGKTFGWIDSCEITSTADPAFYIEEAYFRQWPKGTGVVPVSKCYLRRPDAT